MEPATPNDVPEDSPRPTPLSSPGSNGEPHFGDESEESVAPPDGDDGFFACPHCGQPVDIAPQALAPFVTCPACGGEFALPASEPDAEDEQAEQAAHDRVAARERELDGLHIRN